LNFGKSAGLSGRPLSSRKGGTGDQHALGRTESLRHQPGDVLDLGLCPNGDIKPFLNHIDGPIRGLDEYRNLWM
jgi:hypothetical protein